MQQIILFTLAAIAIASPGDIRGQVKSFEYIHEFDAVSLDAGNKQGIRLQDVNKAGHPDQLELNFYALGRNFTLRVEQKRDLFSSDYKEVDMDEHGNIISAKAGNTKCFYHGNVVFGKNAVGHATLSTCTGGINAFLQLREVQLQGSDETRKRVVLEITHLQDKGLHVIHDIENFSPEKPFKCGVTDDHKWRVDDPLHAHDGHDHDEVHDHDGVHPLDANECNNQPNKYVDLVIVNDNRRYATKGATTQTSSATIASYVNTYYTGGTSGSTTFAGIYDSSSQRCRVTVRLVGQLTFVSANPSDLTYSTGSNCGNACSDSDSCSGAEISSSCLLSTLRLQYGSTHKNELENIFGDVDNIQLFSGENFGGATIGLAYVGTMCGSYSAGIDQTTSASELYNAQVVAHEMGHNFDMSHDSASGNVMNPYASNNIATAWSSESKSYISTYFTSGYTGSRKCLEADRGGDTWNTPVCGNGIVESGESCDLGVGVVDSTGCCNSDCTLSPSCGCSPSQACCTASGQLRPAGYTCRTALHSDCDMPETCDGASADCPVDLFKLSGTTCSDTTAFSVTESGQCYEGNCVSHSDNCGSSSLRYAYDTDSLSPEDRCTNVKCRNCASCSGSFTSTDRGPAVMGTPCGTGMQCETTARECVAASRLYFYHCDGGSCFDSEGNPSSSPDCPVSCGGAGGGGGGGGGSDGNGGVVAGAVIGVLVGVAAIGGVIYLCRTGKIPTPTLPRSTAKRFRKKRKAETKKSPARQWGNTTVQMKSIVNVIPPTPNTSLPPGWKKYFSDDGQPYYFNDQTGESRWDRPVAVSGAGGGTRTVV